MFFHHIQQIEGIANILFFFPDMNTTRLMINNTIPISDLKNNTFLLYFGLPNSRILTINHEDDDDDVLITKSSLEMELIYDNKSNEIVYKTFFSQILHK